MDKKINIKNVKKNKNEKGKELKINKRLPQIILPAEKNKLFIKWYNEDLRYQDEIPKAFSRGYVFLKNTVMGKDKINDEDYKRMFRYLAKENKCTYRYCEDYYLMFIEKTEDTVLYFEFEDNNLTIEVYCSGKQVNTTTIPLDHIEPGEAPTLEDGLKSMIENVEEADFVTHYAYYCFIMLSTVLWYLATTTKPVKYKRENKETSSIYYEKKEVINPKRNKTITTPIYDMSKTRIKNTTGLIKRRKGWTYSHSFQVHGHYRHYANGKTIFIKPFIKGKGKEEMAQTITINPK